MKRPLGVTVIAILSGIVGVASFIAGVSLVILGIYLSMSNLQMSAETNPSGSVFGSVFGVLSAGVGAVWLEIGIGLHHNVLRIIQKQRLGLDDYNNPEYN